MSVVEGPWEKQTGAIDSKLAERRTEVAGIIASELALSKALLGIDIDSDRIDDLIDAAQDKAAMRGLLVGGETLRAAFPGLAEEVAGFLSPEKDEQNLHDKPNMEYLRHLPLPETGDAA